MDQSDKKNLRGAPVRSNLSSSKEEGRLQADWAKSPEDSGLNQLLMQLPDAPISSNFTSRVLRAVELEEAKISRDKRGWPAWRVGFGWVSRLAIAGFSLVVGVLGFQQYQFVQRAQVAQSVETMTQVAVLPTEWLENFETISHLNQPITADEELLAMLQ